MPDDFPVFYQMKQFRHGRFVIVGIGERVDEEEFATLDEFVVMTVTLHAYSVFVYRTCKQK